MARRSPPVTALGFALLLLVAVLPAAEAQAPEPCHVVEGPPTITLEDCSAMPPVKDCKRVEVTGTFVHVMLDPACLGAPGPTPVLPGMEASCAEREMHPESGSTPCCGDAPCCDDPSCCAAGSGCCADPSCCPGPKCCTTPDCCRDPSCCRTPQCCGGMPVCVFGAMVRQVRERQGVEVGNRGVCLDVGQHDNGAVYASVDPASPCTQPPSQERISILP